MPRKNDTRRPQHVIDEAVRRHMNGESAVVLAKLNKISKAGFYLWVKKYKQNLLEQSKRAGMTPADAEHSDKRTLIVELQALKEENQKLRNKVVSLMIKSGDM